MATPASSGYAFHHRFDAVPPNQASAAAEPAAAEPAAAEPTSASSPSAEHFEYPDLDAGHFYSSAAPHTTATPAMSKLPDFPEFNNLDSKSHVFSSNNLFHQYAPHPAASAALVQPQSALIQSRPSSEHFQSTPPPSRLDAPQQPVAAAIQESLPAPVPPVSAEHTRASIHAQAQLQHSHEQAQTPHHPQLERHLSSANSYVQQPSLHGASYDSQAPSHNSHSSPSSPLPNPPSLPTSPPAHAPQLNAAPYPQTAPQAAPAFSFPTQIPPTALPTHVPAATQQQHPPASPQIPLPQPSPNALPMAGLRLSHAQPSADQQSSPQLTNNPDHTRDRIRPNSFFGMQTPAAALNSTRQQVPVPASMLAHHDGFYQHQQHFNHPNRAAQPQQRSHEALPQHPRPSSFFGIEGDSASITAPESVNLPTPVSDASAPPTRRPSLRPDSAPRAISTAAGGTANAPMPPLGGFGGLGPAGANRPASIAPSVASGPLLDHSHLKVGQKASLLSHEKTLELYRQNAKKTNDPNLIYELAVFMIDAAKTIGTDEDGAPVAALNGPNKADAQKEELIKEATGLLKKIADRGHPDAQYFLADCYANGIGTRTGKQDFGQAYTYFVLAAKHGHPDAAYRAGTCYEKGWGCRKDTAKALQFYRKSASQSHPGAMYRLATAELNGELGLKKNAKEGVKWLKRSAEAATPEFPHALHELALLHERGIDNVLFVDPEYSCELLAQAGEMGYAPSAYKLGVNYEYGRMGCPQDGGLSIHMYNIAAQQNHKEACFALTAWYLVGAPGILPQSDTEAYLWAKKAAEQGLAKAEYAVGYFTEMGIGTVKDINEARAWYKRAADHGDKRANQRIAVLQGAGAPTGLPGAGARQTMSPPPLNRQQQRMEQRQEQRESMADFGRRAQPTSAPFPASVTQSSMTPSTQTNYPSPLAMREAQTAQREQQYLANVAANVAANERAQARAMLRHSSSQQEFGSPVSPAPSPSTGLPRPPPMPQQHHQPRPPQRQSSYSSQPPVPFSQPQAYPSYPMSASTAPPPPQPYADGPPMNNPMFPPAPGAPYAARPGPGPAMDAPGSTPPARADVGKDDDKKKKKGWFGRS